MAHRNEQLEHILGMAGLSPAKLAHAVGVDEKTVERWLAGTSRPYRNHQYAAAKALGVDRRDLWPDPVQPPDTPASDLVSLYDSRLDIPEGLWADLTGTPGDIEILSDDLCWFLDTHPLLGAELNCHALQGGRIQLCLLDPDRVDTTSAPGALEAAAFARHTISSFDPLLDIDRAIHAQIRLHQGSALSIYRFGTEMLVQPTLDGLADALSPVLHLRRTVECGTFDRYLNHVRHVWHRASAVPKHKREVLGPGPQIIPPELVGIEDARADASRARARASLRDLLVDLTDETHMRLYDLGPELFELLLPAMGASGERHRRLRAAGHGATLLASPDKL